MIRSGLERAYDVTRSSSRRHNNVVFATMIKAANDYFRAGIGQCRGSDPQIAARLRDEGHLQCDSEGLRKYQRWKCKGRLKGGTGLSLEEF